MTRTVTEPVSTHATLVTADTPSTSRLKSSHRLLRAQHQKSLKTRVLRRSNEATSARKTCARPAIPRRIP